FLDFRTPSAWLIVLGAAASLAAGRRVLPFWLWAAAAAVFLLFQKPLFEHHLMLLAATLGAAGGLGLGAVRLLPRQAARVLAGVLAIALAIGFAQQVHRLDYARAGEAPELRWGAEHLAACTRPGELVASDQPIVAFQARRPLPGELVDTSLVRVQTG